LAIIGQVPAPRPIDILIQCGTLALTMATLLQLQEVTKSYGPRLLFDAVTVSIADGQRIGFVGANG